MTARRFHTSPTVTPARTGGDDRPRAKCDGDYVPFDVLAHTTAGRGYQAAKNEILSDRLCGGCVLRDAGCWADNKARREPWFFSLLGKPVPRHPKGAVA